MPSGQMITPLAPTGSKFSELNPGLKDFPNYTVGQAIKTAISPDGNMLLILTSGYNRLNDAQGNRSAADSKEYVFVFDLTHGSLKQTQVLQVPNTFIGLAIAPNGNQFFVSGGGDDNVHVFSKDNGTWTEAGTPIALGHKHGSGQRAGSFVANLAVTADGKTLAAADISENAVSLIDISSRAKLGELDLRPEALRARRSEGRDETRALTPAELGAVSGGAAKDAVAGGEAPFGVAIKGSTIAYVSSERDREVDVVDIAQPNQPELVSRIPVKGSPNNLVMNAAQTLLFVAADNSDRDHALIDTATNRTVEKRFTPRLGTTAGSNARP